MTPWKDGEHRAHLRFEVENGDDKHPGMFDSLVCVARSRFRRSGWPCGAGKKGGEPPFSGLPMARKSHRAAEHAEEQERGGDAAPFLLLLGRFGGRLGGVLAPSWGCLGAVLGCFGAVLVRLGASWNASSQIFAPS